MTAASPTTEGPQARSPCSGEQVARFGVPPDEDGRCGLCRDLEVVLSGRNSQHRIEEASCSRCGRQIPVQIHVEMTFRGAA